MLAASRPVLRSAARSLQITARRGYAEEAAASSKLKLTLAMPHGTIYRSSEVLQVNVPAASGELGVLANHVPTVETLKPGIVEVIEANGAEPKKYFVSGGIASMHPSGGLTVNAVEAYELGDFSPEAIKSGLAESQRVANGNGPEEEKAEAKLEIEVYEALQHAVRA